MQLTMSSLTNAKVGPFDIRAKEGNRVCFSTIKVVVQDFCLKRGSANRLRYTNSSAIIGSKTDSITPIQATRLDAVGCMSVHSLKAAILIAGLTYVWPKTISAKHELG